MPFWSPTLAKYWWLLAIPVRAVHRRPAESAAAAPAEAEPGN
ncbi:hypothetical protein [Streptomyces sp. NPDC054804]